MPIYSRQHLHMKWKGTRMVSYAGFSVAVVARRGGDLYEQFGVENGDALASRIAAVLDEYFYPVREYDGDLDVTFIDEQAGA